MLKNIFLPRIAEHAGSFSLPNLNSSPIFLPENAVHIWLLDNILITRASSMLAHLLSHAEQKRAAAYEHKSHRNHFIAVRSMLRWLMSRYLACDCASLQFCATKFGKPVLNNAYATRIVFNVSHTDGMSIIAFAQDCEVGVDVERLVNGLNVTSIGQEVFSSIEAEKLNVTSSNLEEIFFSIWTRKEALLKALGTGFFADPTSYTTEDDFLVGKDHWSASHNSVPITHGWTCLDLSLGEEVRGALAVSCNNAKVTIQHCEF